VTWLAQLVFYHNKYDYAVISIITTIIILIILIIVLTIIRRASSLIQGLYSPHNSTLAHGLSMKNLSRWVSSLYARDKVLVKHNEMSTQAYVLHYMLYMRIDDHGMTMTFSHSSGWLFILLWFERGEDGTG